MTTITFHHHDTLAAACATAAALILDDLRAALADRGRALLVVSGGRTPETLFPLLAAAPLDWHRVGVTLADERWVPPDHPDSNEGLARRLLAAPTGAPLVGLWTGHGDPAAGLGACSERLADLPLPATVSFLGVGPDGHVASLFPDDPTWRADMAGLGHPVAASGDRAARMSLTPRALLATGRIVLVAGGADKRAVLERAREPGPEAELPVRLLLRQDRVPVDVVTAG